MKDTDIFLKEANLILTDTISELKFNNYNQEINYDNCISLFELVSSFNKLYIKFKKEYDKLKKIDLGEEIHVIDFGKYENNYRTTSLYIKKPKITNHEQTLLYLIDENGRINPYITNIPLKTNEQDYTKNIKLDEKLVKGYLDLFEKYKVLIDLYNTLKNAYIMGDGTFSMYTVIDNYNSNLLSGLKEFEISFGNHYFQSEDFMNLSINLGKKFGINKEHSHFVIDNKEIPLTTNAYKTILKRVYVNKKYTAKSTNHC